MYLHRAYLMRDDVYFIGVGSTRAEGVLVNDQTNAPMAFSRAQAKAIRDKGRAPKGYRLAFEVPAPEPTDDRPLTKKLHQDRLAKRRARMIEVWEELGADGLPRYGKPIPRTATDAEIITE